MMTPWGRGLAALAVVAGEAPPALRTSGFVEAAYAASTRAADGAIAGNLYLPRQETFAFDAAMLRVERAAPAGRAGTGFVLEALAGEQARVVRAAGLDLGEHADLVQAFGMLSFPSTGLVISAGKMATLLGNEVIETVVNPNLSVGYACALVENFTDTGLDVAWTGRGGWSARGRVVNGWDVVTDNNRSKTVFGRVGWSRPSASLAAFGYSGVELPDSVGGRRSGGELLAGATVRGVALTLQLDAGREEVLDASWRAAGLWVRAPLRGALELCLRGDVLDDPDGARTSGAVGLPVNDGQRVGSLTATLGVRTLAGALIRPELRWDHSDLPAFDGHHAQWTYALGAAFTF